MSFLKNRQTMSSRENGIQEGVIDAVLTPGKTWRVRADGGVYWRGITLTDSDFSPGDSINVVGRKNNQLLIEHQ